MWFLYLSNKFIANVAGLHTKFSYFVILRKNLEYLKNRGIMGTTVNGRFDPFLSVNFMDNGERKLRIMKTYWNCLKNDVASGHLKPTR